MSQTWLAAMRENEAELLAMIEALRRALEAARRTRDRDREEAPPSREFPGTFHGTPPWAAGFVFIDQPGLRQGEQKPIPQPGGGG